MLEPWGDRDRADWARSLPFVEPFRPRFAETDGLGHVSNTVYATYVELGRLHYLAALGDETPGRAFPFQHVIAELAIRYVAPAHHDEALAVRVGIRAVGRSSLTIEYALTAAEDPADLRAAAVTTVVSFDGVAPAPWNTAQRAALVAALTPV